MKRAILNFIESVRAKAAELVDIRDAHVYGGLAMFGYGVYLVFPPAAFAACGLFLFWMGVRK